MTENQRKYYESSRRKIVAVDKDGSMAGCFDSIKDLAEQHKLTKHHIVRSCKTGKLYRGVRWMYEEDYHRYWLNGQTALLSYERPDWQKPMMRGDGHDHYCNDAKCREYVRSLIKRFGTDDITLAQIQELLEAKE